MTRDELINAIRDANTNDRWAELVALIASTDSPEQFRTIFAHAVEPQAIGSAVVDAARLLFESNITCRLSCESAINALVPTWDISIEEVPWYLANQFGSDSLLDCVNRMLETSPRENVCSTLKSVRYWIELNPTVG